MIIHHNGEETTIANPQLNEALRELGYIEGRFATAVNENFVPISERQTITLRDGDRLEVVAPMSGG
ncbi:sulfur carrier protein ThiS [Kiloniella sp. b19]|uniref:sulfur carrier protein ThiS n=1 Tax=Kiloniella sp. GXU_MW_B19 TaxID=3141326 RepID=UPI0031D04D95